MSIVRNEFTCPDGHKFNAIAKLRARCTECGKMSRRQFTSQNPLSESVTPSTSSPSFRKAAHRKDMGSGSKPDSISTKESESKTQEPKPQEPAKPATSKESQTSNRRLQVVKRGMPRTAKKPVSRSTAIKPPEKKGPVKQVVARRAHAPTVTRPPKGSRERKVIEQTTDEPFWLQAKRKFFR